ncbi:hypothetical protein VKT23_013532 [Stygiomarasmius scandens]|uniref:Uncharacterized protein n=1 Tax=Marasmiellus scandens TaxID=2682957 RepID=A0ABR1J6G3_9AGAR
MWGFVALSFLGLTAQAYVIPNNTATASWSESLGPRGKTKPCQGYQFGIIDVAFQTGLGGEGYAVMDGECNQMIGIVTPNPCVETIFACSPAPIKLTHLRFHGKNMECEQIDNMGSCQGYPVQFCCGKDDSKEAPKNSDKSKDDS